MGLIGECYMEISEKLNRIVNGYMRMQYSIAIKEFAVVKRIVYSGKKVSRENRELNISFINSVKALRQSYYFAPKGINRSYDIITHTKPNPPIA